MAFETPITGSPTVGTTEYFLASASTTATYQTADRTVQVFIDTSAMATGDQFKITIYEKVNGGTAKAVQQSWLTGAQSTAWVSPALVLTEGWEIGVVKVTGTDRSLPYAVKPLS